MNHNRFSGETPKISLGKTRPHGLRWIDDNIDGHPYGVDILVPEHQALGGVSDIAALVEQVPQRHRDFVIQLLARNGIEMRPGEEVDSALPTTLPEVGEALIDVAFRHPIRLIVNALGIAPQIMLDRARTHGVPVGALVGAKEHAVRQVRAGIDLLIAQGAEAGGHCGDVSTLVLLPEVIRAIAPLKDVPVLAAGGIMTGEQMAGCMAMGAAGVWTGSVWLASVEAETTPIFREKMVAATSRDTVRSKSRTGKPSRQLRTSWHEAWDGPDSPGALPMPLMVLLSNPAFARIDREAQNGNAMARELTSYFVGQGVGLVNEIKSSRSIVQEFREEFCEAVLRLSKSMDS